LEGFWVREERKDHGTEKKIEGGLQTGMRVAILEDVSTTGGSAMKAVQAVRGFGCQVGSVITLVDREQGARELFEKEGIEFMPIFSIKDVLGREESKGD
jgi:orotate phosphoribosyltransferase